MSGKALVARVRVKNNGEYPRLAPCGSQFLIIFG